jgi:hypothetical protein
MKMHSDFEPCVKSIASFLLPVIMPTVASAAHVSIVLDWSLCSVELEAIEGF